MKRLVAPYNLETVNSVSWGINHEETVLMQYASLHGITEPTGRCAKSFQQIALRHEICIDFWND